MTPPEGPAAPRSSPEDGEAVDADLMRRFGEGDDDAFRMLVARHERALLNFFWRRCFDRATAEDCVQEVFLRIVRHRGSWRPDAKFTTWLHRVAENLWIDRYRSRKSVPPPASLDAMADDDSGAGAAQIAASDPGPEKLARDRELAARIQRAIVRLSEPQRAVFALAGVRGMKYEEAADVLGIPIGTVRSRMHAALTRLREILAEEGHEIVR